jgi:hypothetical protein
VGDSISVTDQLHAVRFEVPYQSSTVSHVHPASPWCVLDAGADVTVTEFWIGLKHLCPLKSTDAFKDAVSEA